MKLDMKEFLLENEKKKYSWLKLLINNCKLYYETLSHFHFHKKNWLKAVSDIKLMIIIRRSEFITTGLMHFLQCIVRALHQQCKPPSGWVMAACHKLKTCANKIYVINLRDKDKRGNTCVTESILIAPL